MPDHSIHSDLVEILHRGGEPDCVSGVRGSSLELVREDVPRCPIVVHELDHVTAGLIRWHLLEHLALADQPADSHRAKHLVSAESVEIDAE